MALTQIKAAALTADLIDETKLADNSIDSEHYNDGSIDNAHLADDAVGVAELSATGTASSSTFLRGDNSWAAVTSTTINNNADNRVITGSGTANTLEGESGLTYNGSSSLVISGSGQQQLTIGSTDAGGAVITLDGDSNGDGAGGDYSFIRHNTDGDLEFFARSTGGATNTIFKQSTTESMRIDSSGNVGIGVVPKSGQYSGYNHLQVGECATLSSNDTNSDTNITSLIHNAYLDATASNWKYLHSDEASRYQQYNGVHYFSRASSGTADGNISFADKLKIDSDGIKFNSDTAAANALDDYEEGEYTPTITLGSGSASLQSSYDRVRYTKIGRQVTLTGQLVFNAHSSGGGTLNISLPFANGNGNDRAEYVLAAGIGFFSTTNSSSPNNDIQNIGFLITANSSNATVYGLHPNYDSTIGNWVGTGSDIWFNLTYFTDA